MRPELRQLLDRFCNDAPQPGSTQTIAWNAHREAEKLIDRSVVDELLQFISTEKDRRKRGHAYFIIGKVGMNLADPTCAEILINALGREQDKYVIAFTLDRLADIPKPAALDLTRIFTLLDDPRWLVRRAAIKALKNSASAEAESRIIALLENTRDADDVTYCQATLNQIGTPRAIPAIEPNLKSRKRDVRISAKFAIEAIRARHPNA